MFGRLLCAPRELVFSIFMICTQNGFSLLVSPVQNHYIARNKLSLTCGGKKLDSIMCFILYHYENGILNSNTSIVPLDVVIMWLAN